MDEKIQTALGDIVGPDHLLSSPDDLSTYAIDGLIPKVAVFPESVEQVSKAVRLASRESLALVSWGGGTKMGTGNPPSRFDVALCVKRLNRIIDMDTANLTVTVQAGVPFKDVQQSLGTQENRCYLPLEGDATAVEPVCSERDFKGCFIPLWPPFSDAATIGGVLAADSSGHTRLLYGRPRDLVLGIRYVAPDGEIIGMGGKTVKNVSGYDMTKLMIGSRGSLGIICEATLRLLPLPERRETGIYLFPGLDEADGFVHRLFESHLLPAAVELMNQPTFGLLMPDHRVEDNAFGYAIAVALEGFSEPVERMIQELGNIASDQGTGRTILLDENRHGTFWNNYSNLLPEHTADPKKGVSLTLHYPVSHDREVIEQVESAVSDGDLDLFLFARTASGTTGAHILYDPEAERIFERVVHVVEEVLQVCRNVGGNLVVERADKDLKKQLDPWGPPSSDHLLMKRIKEQIDPLNLFSPGRFVGGI
jgi:FAD/FMN-containing dehydrogenase